uniref:Uncharacterized protein n=1 Tax=viral metagenome TaxID=1070528 RepID=A0A6C0AE60_9ZZZZ
MKLQDIPEWLRNGNLYQSFLEDEEDLNIEDKFIKYTNEIENIEDFISVFNISKYWQIDYPESFYEYAFENKFEVLKYLFSEHDDKNKEIDFLIKDKSENIKYDFIPFTSKDITELHVAVYGRAAYQFYYLTLIISKSIIISFFLIKYKKVFSFNICICIKFLNCV